MDKKCILVTGPAHSATRLLVRMLSKHPDVCTAAGSLNSVSEFVPLHQFFIQSIDNTPLASSDYSIDREDLFFIIEAFFKNIDANINYFVIKMPFYPLLCMPYFVDLFGENLIPVYTDRPTNRIVKSFLSRGEDKLYFKKRPQAIFRQIKKLPVNLRKKHLGMLNPALFFEALSDHTRTLKNQWNANNPSKSFHVIEVESLTKTKKEYKNFLKKSGLPLTNVDESFEVIDKKRLLSSRTGLKLKRLIKRILD